MGRSATLCGGKPQQLWAEILEHRKFLKQNLTRYLAEPSCLRANVEPGFEPSEYLSQLTKGYVVAIRRELESQDSAPPLYGVTVSFGIIYAELWNQATLLAQDHPTTTPAELRWRQDSGARLHLEDLQKFNQVDSEVSHLSPAQEAVIDISTLLSQAYIKVLAECYVAAKGSDPDEIHHHLLVLGDILQEKLELHATLAPRASDA